MAAIGRFATDNAGTLFECSFADRAVVRFHDLCGRCRLAVEKNCDNRRCAPHRRVDRFLADRWNYRGGWLPACQKFLRGRIAFPHAWLGRAAFASEYYFANAE